VKYRIVLKRSSERLARIQDAVEICPSSISATGLVLLSMAERKFTICARVAGAAKSSMSFSCRSAGYFSLSNNTSPWIFSPFPAGMKS
jgi:hypothetical protein